MNVQRRVRQRTRSRRVRLVLDEQGGGAIVGTPGGVHDHYPAGPPAVRLSGAGGQAPRVDSGGRDAGARVEASGRSARSGGGHPGYANSVRLEGRTDADFSGSTFRTVDGTTRPAKGCKACGADDCQRATGKIVMTFQVATTVTLPNPDPDLTPCQLQRVRNAIRTILAPHEQRHVSAFSTYDGTVVKPFDLTLCSGDFDAAIQSMFDAVEKRRRAAAQAKSDKLDPFFFDVNIDCKDSPKQGKRASNDPSDSSPEAESPA